MRREITAEEARAIEAQAVEKLKKPGFQADFRGSGAFCTTFYTLVQKSAPQLRNSTGAVIASSGSAAAFDVRLNDYDPGYWPQVTEVTQPGHGSVEIDEYGPPCCTPRRW